MALGGGSFTTQNQPLPGCYVNLVSGARATGSAGTRGVCALPVSMSWGALGVTSITAEDALRADWYPKSVREALCRAARVLVVRLGSGGAAASGTLGRARYPGTYGNKITVSVLADPDEATIFHVETRVDGALKDAQQVTAAAGLTDNDFVLWDESATLAEGETAFAGGVDPAVTGQAWTEALAMLEAHTFDALGIDSADADVIATAIAYTRRMRDECGVKFQCVVYRAAADAEGVVSVWNARALVPWVAGACAGAPLGKSLTHTRYDGAEDAPVGLTQTELAVRLGEGHFLFHRVGDEVRVLLDRNTKLDSELSSNQVLRTLDAIANDVARIFTGTYLGRVPNDAAGRMSLWNDITRHHTDLMRAGALSAFEPDDITVSAGAAADTVVVTDNVTPTDAMTRMYLTVIVQ